MCLKMDVPGMGTAIICGSRTRAKDCKFCLANGGRKVPSTKLCDFPTGTGKTCDAPICDRHATSAGLDLDHCPVHSQQQGLFPKEAA